jgi:hypothetical protein
MITQRAKLAQSHESLLPIELSCPRLPAFKIDSWKDINTAFFQAERCHLRQAWRTEAEELFRDGNVCAGWSDSSLFIYAELNDDDIFNPTVELNAPSYQAGDVFEIFLRPPEQTSYFEFHVTPQNQKLQLKIPSPEAFRNWDRETGLPRTWLVSDRVIETRVRVHPQEGKWWVLAAIPFEMVAEVKHPKAGSQWLFSFSRYDYTRGQAAPVLSSTSPHQELGFHRQQEWGTLVFL